MEAHNIKQAIKHQLKELLKEQQEETLNHFSEAVLICKDIMELENFNEEIAHTMRKKYFKHINWLIGKNNVSTSYLFEDIESTLNAYPD